MKTDNVKVILTEKLMGIVKTLCELRPHNEWSGTIYYKPKFNEDGSIEIKVLDFALMDYEGSSTLTTFSNNDNYAVVYKNKYRLQLLGSRTGLLHSHHGMLTCGPSGTDNNTMMKEGEAPDMDNFLSIIVYNSLKNFSVRITQRELTKIKPEETTVRVFGRDIKEDSDIKFEDYKETKIINITDVIYEEPRELTEEEMGVLNERIEELKKKISSTPTTKYVGGVGSTKSTSTYSSSFFKYWDKKDNDRKKPLDLDDYYYSKYSDYYGLGDEVDDPYGLYYYGAPAWGNYVGSGKNNSKSKKKDKKKSVGPTEGLSQTEDLAFKLITLSYTNINEDVDLCTLLTTIDEKLSSEFLDMDSYINAVGSFYTTFRVKSIELLGFSEWNTLIKEAVESIRDFNINFAESIFMNELIEIIKTRENLKFGAI